MFAAIWIPNFRLQAAGRWREKTLASAVIDTSESRALILEASAAAKASGVQAGITSAQALARCPGLNILPRSIAQEEACGAVLLETAFAFSPRVEKTAADLATLDLTTALRNACWQRLGETIVDRLRAEALSAVAGFAPNPDHAALAARCASPVNVVYDGAAFCAGLPLASLAPDPATLAILSEWGIRTIGELLRLPKTDVITRLGPEATRLWRQASGRSRRTLRLALPRECFVENYAFDHPVETTEPLLFLLRRFLDALSKRIRDQHRVTGRMRFTLPLDDGTRHEREFAVPAPTTDADVLFRIIDTHVESLRLDQQPVGLRLELLAAAPLGRQLALFEKGLRDPNGLGETLARLQAVVGKGCVGTPVHGDTHQPDTCGLTEFDDQAVASTPAGICFGLPLRRLRPPAQVRVRLAANVPAWIDALDWAGPVERVSGPYRLSGAWWSEATWAIEEWDAEIDGRGLVRLGRRTDGWTIEGIYNLCNGGGLR